MIYDKKTVSVNGQNDDPFKNVTKSGWIESQILSSFQTKTSCNIHSSLRIKKYDEIKSSLFII